MEIIGKINNHWFASTYLGKKVYSLSGMYIGKVKDVIMEQHTAVGLQVDKKLLISLEHVQSNENQIMLNINPVTLLVGKKVFDKSGRDLGKVVKIERKSNANTYSAIFVKKKFWNKPHRIDSSSVHTAQDNILLKDDYE